MDRKHVDFLVCDLKSVRPLVALELDDQSHARADRKTRDELVEAVFAAAGLPLLRVPVKSGYAPQEFQALINPYLQSMSQVPPIAPVAPTLAPSAHASATAPTCPKCSATMLLRTAKTGANAGGKFWACPNFPRCRTTIALPE